MFILTTFTIAVFLKRIQHVVKTAF